MGPAAVGTAIGAATLTVGQGAIAALGSGLSFLAQLTSATKDAGSETQRKTASSSYEVIKLRCDELQQRIQWQLAAFRIRLSKPVELVSNGQGGIAVAGSHPQAAEIEAALASDLLLERDFNLLA